MFRKYVLFGCFIYEMKSPEMLKEMLNYIQTGCGTSLSFILSDVKLGECYDLNEIRGDQIQKILTGLKE